MTSTNPTAGTRRPTALYVGLALTVLAAVAPLLDIATVDTLAGHVRDAYPHWSPHSVALDRNAIAIYLAGTAALGIPLWLVTIRGAARRRRWAPIVATVAFAAGALLALINLTVGGEQYDVIVPYSYGALTALPCVAGAVALVSVWRGRRA
jgi:hypothetical protein